jgi:hypothetical protein
MTYKKLSIIELGTIVASFAVLALSWRSSASYISLTLVFLAGTGRDTRGDEEPIDVKDVID